MQPVLLNHEEVALRTLLCVTLGRVWPLPLRSLFSKIWPYIWGKKRKKNRLVRIKMNLFVITFSFKRAWAKGVNTTQYVEPTWEWQCTVNVNKSLICSLIFCFLQDRRCCAHCFLLLCRGAVQGEERRAPQLVVHVLDDRRDLCIGHGLGHYTALRWVGKTHTGSLRLNEYHFFFTVEHCEELHWLH